MALGGYAVGNRSIHANIKIRQHWTVYAFLVLLLERSLAAKTQSFQALWVLYPQFLRMEHHTWECVTGVAIGVEWIAQNRVTQGLHMNAQLVTTTGMRTKPEATFVI